MKAGGHFVSSLIGAGLFYGIFSNFISAIIFFISSFFIDLDHIFDYVRQYGLRNLKLQNFFEACDQHRLVKTTLVFHSFELLLILWFIITVYKLNILWIALALGISLHLIIDQFTNGAFVFSYFFTYRWIKNFKTEKLFVIKDKGSACP